MAKSFVFCLVTLFQIDYMQFDGLPVMKTPARGGWRDKTCSLYRTTNKTTLLNHLHCSHKALQS
ncbi:hypothetical protein E2C01_013139 [Portunus trituberculatus]|uniref:Secreted protein n=1 Tax=Portunus trituberculatus TaxID=210409 RepID=A0A5B7DG78_PORTR|nr:hypothetical protein [Portunus trituberculatus]